jgi:hypothetical protein
LSDESAESSLSDASDVTHGNIVKMSSFHEVSLEASELFRLDTEIELAGRSGAVGSELEGVVIVGKDYCLVVDKDCSLVVGRYIDLVVCKLVVGREAVVDSFDGCDCMVVERNCHRQVVEVEFA